MSHASFEVLFAVTCTGPDTTRYHVGPRNRQFLSVRPGPGAHEGLLTDTGNPLRPGLWSLSPGTHWQIGNLRSTSSQIPAAAFRTPPPIAPPQGMGRSNRPTKAIPRRTTTVITFSGRAAAHSVTWGRRGWNPKCVVGLVSLLGSN